MRHTDCGLAVVDLIGIAVAAARLINACRGMPAGRLLLPVLLALAAAAGCSDATGPTTGTIALSVVTTGADPDPDGYTVSLDGSAPRPVGANATLALGGVAPGAHTLALAGLATNCTVVGGPRGRRVTVPAGREASVTFAVSCAARVGAVRVVAVTTARIRDLDPDGYTVSVDGGAAQPIGVNASLLVGGLREGTHTVALTGVAQNRTVVSANPQTATIAFGATVDASFAVTCDFVGYGSISGVVRGSGAGYPWGAGNPGESPNGWPVTIRASGPGRTPPVTWMDDQTGAFSFDSMPAGQWQLSFGGMLPWSGVFPNVRLYDDTAITVTVAPNQAVVLPEMVLPPVAPFVIIATQLCPWGLPDPPSLDDWADCDNGYWLSPGVTIDVTGVPGTSTAGVNNRVTLPANQGYHRTLSDLAAGSYDVTLAAVDAGRVGWRLVPWTRPAVRITVGPGLTYVLFDFFYSYPR